MTPTSIEGLLWFPLPREAKSAQREVSAVTKHQAGFVSELFFQFPDRQAIWPRP
jgi:hypothetical protein